MATLKKVPKELKVGILAIVTIILLLVGLSYLKGYSVMSSTMSLFAVFDEVKGLKAGDQVIIKGHQVGQVEEVSFSPVSQKIIVEFWIYNEIPLPEGSFVEIFAKDFLGTMALQIQLGKSKKLLENQDTLPGKIAPSLMEDIKQEVIPVKDEVTKTLTHLQPILKGLQALFGNTQKMKQLQTNFVATSSELNKLMKKLNLLTDDFKTTTSHLNDILKENKSSLKNITENTAALTKKSKELLPKLDSNLTAMQQTLQNLNTLLDSLNRGNGTASKMLHDPRLYESLNQSVQSLDKLLVELKEHPERFVHFSLFGRKEKKKKK